MTKQEMLYEQYNDALFRLLMPVLHSIRGSSTRRKTRR